MPAQPTLETDRLILRPFKLADAPRVRELAGSRAIADTTLHIPHPYEQGMAEEWIGTHRERWKAGQGVDFAIVDKEERALIGAIGLAIDRAHDSAELGYWIGEPYWARGYATGAAAAIIRFGFDQLHLNRIHAFHYTRNPASGRVLAKVGMTREGLFRQAIKKWDVYEDVICCAIVRGDLPDLHRAG